MDKYSLGESPNTKIYVIQMPSQDSHKADRQIQA